MALVGGKMLQNSIYGKTENVMNVPQGPAGSPLVIPHMTGPHSYTFLGPVRIGVSA